MIELNTIGDGSHSELITSEHQTESNNEIKNPERSQKNDCPGVLKEHEPCKKKEKHSLRSFGLVRPNCGRAVWTEGFRI